MVETLHLDVEGGVGERRTSAPPSAGVETPHVHLPPESGKKPTVVVELESEIPEARPLKPERIKKKVMFQSDRPDLYDF